MGFWIFMTSMDLLVPLIMMGFGSRFQRHAPKEINGFYGYRTSRSVKNRDTWVYAHHYSGRLFFQSGLVMLLLAVAISLFILGKGETIVAIVGCSVIVLQIIPMLVVIFFTEKALKKIFDDNGNRRI